MSSKQLLFSLGRPFSPFYGAIMKFREKFFDKQIFKTQSLPIPVISVGNLTLGGTGKTPVVQYIAKLLQNNGYKPAVVSRGYGGKAASRVNVVADDTNIYLAAGDAGDEPVFLAESVKGLYVLTGKKRYPVGKKAIELGADVILLDDGFQHMQLQRDVNLVLFNSDVLAGNSRIFPGGDLREPVSALRRATGFILTGVRTDNQERAEKFAALLESKFPGIPVYYANYQVDEVIVEGEEKRINLNENVIDDKVTSFFAVCGIAHPELFLNTLKQNNIDIKGSMLLPDHAAYSERIIQKLNDRVANSKAKYIITTEKDMVKLKAFQLSLPVAVLKMKVVVNADFDKAILQEMSV